LFEPCFFFLNKRFDLSAAGVLSCIVLAAVLVSKTRLIHHTSSNGKAEFIYLEDSLALFRLKTPDFGLGHAYWRGQPDFVWETGDVVTNVIVDRVDALASKNKTVFGKSVKWQQKTPRRDMEAEWFVIRGQDLERYSSREELLQRHKELSGRTPLPLNDFLAANRLRYEKHEQPRR
jgi:hypothetical protein